MGYATKVLRLDVAGVWSANPAIRTIADLLRTYAANSLAGYQSLALIAHSMGGLAVQRALVDDAQFVGRVSHVLHYGTPSNGLVKAWWIQFWKRQIRDMSVESRFITQLRQAWSDKIGKRPPFRFLAVAGDQDEFVPRMSSIDLFEEDQRAVVPGNHVEIVKPEAADALSLQVAANFLAGDASPTGLWSADRVAIESRQFHDAIQRLLPNKDELDEPALVQLALALESVGRQDEAIQLLESRRHRGETDAMGVLAGRLKRRWMVEHCAEDAQRALDLYAAAFTKADKKPGETPEGHTQAFYHGINVAFMELPYGNDRLAAQRMAHRALDHAKKAPHDKWRFATEGEVFLHLGQTEAAIAAYRNAVDLKPGPRELRSMYQQAILVARHLMYTDAESELESLFRSGNK